MVSTMAEEDQTILGLECANSLSRSAEAVGACCLKSEATDPGSVPAPTVVGNLSSPGD